MKTNVTKEVPTRNRFEALTKLDDEANTPPDVSDLRKMPVKLLDAVRPESRNRLRKKKSNVIMFGVCFGGCCEGKRYNETGCNSVRSERSSRRVRFLLEEEKSHDVDFAPRAPCLGQEDNLHRCTFF